MRRAIALMLFLACATEVLAQAPPKAKAKRPPSPAEVARLIEEQRQLIEEQRRLLEEQGRKIEELEKQLGETRSLALSAQGRLDQIQSQPAPAPAVDTDLVERLAKVEAAVGKDPDLAAKEVQVEFPHSLGIPGRKSRFRIGGLARLVMINTFDALGSDDRFVSSSIPVEGSEAAGKSERMSFSVVPSRVNLDWRTPTDVGPMRVFVEGDFATVAGANRTMRLRHAYGQWRQFLAGQTWSTFSDPEAEPDGLDFEGLNAISLSRQAQVRWQRSLGETRTLAFALEDPRPSLTGATGVSQAPDIIFRLRWEPKAAPWHFNILGPGSHIQTAVLLRSVRGEPNGQPNRTLAANGYGLNTSGVVPARWWADSDNVSFAYNFGKGIGRYITDLDSLGGQDAVYNPESDRLEVLPAASAYMGYQHWWTATVRSTATMGFVWVDNLDIQPQDAMKRTERYTLNLVWSPIPQLDLVAELLWGSRFNKDGKHGDAKQLQIGGTFRF